MSFAKNTISLLIFLLASGMIEGCGSSSYDQLKIQNSDGSDLMTLKEYHNVEVPASVLPNFNLYLSKVAPKNYEIVKKEKPMESRFTLDFEVVATYYCGILKDEHGKLYSFGYGEAIAKGSNEKPAYFSSLSEQKYSCGGAFEDGKEKRIREYRSDK